MLNSNNQEDQEVHIELKKLAKGSYILENLKGLKWYEPDTGCCGMAGSFGYQKDHYEVSEPIANLVLIPEIDKKSANTLVVTNGFSCRNQIADFSKTKAVHWVECVEFVPEK